MSTNVTAAKIILQHAMLEDFFIQLKQMMVKNDFRYLKLVPSCDICSGEIFNDFDFPTFNVEVIASDDTETTPDEIDCGYDINTLMEEAGMEMVEDLVLATYMDEECSVEVTPDTTLSQFKAQFSQAPSLNGRKFGSDFVLGDVIIPEKN